MLPGRERRAPELQAVARVHCVHESALVQARLGRARARPGARGDGRVRAKIAPLGQAGHDDRVRPRDKVVSPPLDGQDAAYPRSQRRSSRVHEVAGVKYQVWPGACLSQQYQEGTAGAHGGTGSEGTFA